MSAIIYDQVCATEKRRRRKRGTMAAAELKVSINARVCENCGDCTVQSHCIAIEPIDTEYGRKRRISPTSCNTDLSCLKGFCPSFVTAATDAPKHDGAADWEAREAEFAAGLPTPALPDLATPWRGLFAGIGGGGIVTAGAVVAMAASIEGRQVSTLDFTGLAQKNGAVISHVQIAESGLDVVRIPTGEADLMLAADLAVGAQKGVLERMRRGGAVIGNLDLQANTQFLTDRDLVIDAGLHRRVIDRAVGGNASTYLRASALSERLFGQSQALNTLMTGLAWQAGLLPVGQDALLRAIELNGTAVALNRRAFTWGRILHARPELAQAVLSGEALPPPRWTRCWMRGKPSWCATALPAWPGAIAAWRTGRRRARRPCSGSPAALPAPWRRACSAPTPTRTSTRSPACTPPPSMASARCSTWHRP